MKKIAHWTLVILICIFAFCSIYVCFALMIGSGFIFGDIEYTEAQRQAAETKRAIFSIFCFLGLCLSVTILFVSGRIASFILEIFGVSNVTHKIDVEWKQAAFPSDENAANKSMERSAVTSPLWAAREPRPFISIVSCLLWYERAYHD